MTDFVNFNPPLDKLDCVEIADALIGVDILSDVDCGFISSLNHQDGIKLTN